MLARLSAFVVWALVAGLVMFWGLKVLIQPSVAPAGAVPVIEAGGPRGDLSKLLGGEAGPAAVFVAPERSRFQLLGVMAGTSVLDGASSGIALISIDGKPPRTFAAGSMIDDRLVVQSLGLRTAALGPAAGPVSFVLEIPALTPAATGNLSSATDSLVQTPAPVFAAPESAPTPTPTPARRIRGGRPERVR